MEPSGTPTELQVMHRIEGKMLSCLSHNIPGWHPAVDQIIQSSKITEISASSNVTPANKRPLFARPLLCFLLTYRFPEESMDIWTKELADMSEELMNDPMAVVRSLNDARNLCTAGFLMRRQIQASFF